MHVCVLVQRPVAFAPHAGGLVTSPQPLAPSQKPASCRPPPHLALVLQVFDGKRLPENGRPLADSGVQDGSLLIMLTKRAPPPPSPEPVRAPGPAPKPSPAEVERVIRAEAARQGVEVEPSPPVQAPVHSIEQLQNLMQVRLGFVNGMTWFL